ncbi:MAG TPA: hypothetical protein VJM69_05520 [Dehalococcoidia bacterium]|nr:hypothetical protein [Dehalococcoidia bacterium]
MERAPATQSWPTPKGQRGTLRFFYARIKDGFDRPSLERLLALFHDQRDGSLAAVNPR